MACLLFAMVDSVDGYGGSTLGFVGPMDRGQVIYVRWSRWTINGCFIHLR